MDLYQAMSTQRAVRRLRPDPIPEDVLQRVLQAATWAPSGGNVQPWRLVLVRDAAQKRALETLYAPLWSQYIERNRERLQASWNEAEAGMRRTIAAGDYLASHMHEAPAIAVFCFFAYPQFEAPHPQLKTFVLRRRYWLYYALQFMAGARRQIFIVFAAFMMVERFGFEVHQLTALFLINYLANMLFAPFMGHAVARWGERKALAFEYIGLIAVFLSYGGIYFFGWGVVLAAGLYVVDHLFFALAYNAAGVPVAAGILYPFLGILISPIFAAVFLPALLGYLWVTSPSSVFGLAAGMAATSLVLACMIPRHPEPGHETVFSKVLTAPAE